MGKFETNRRGGWWGEVLWHLWVLWRQLDAPGFVLVELCVFCAVRREGDKVKQYRHCRPGSPLLSSLGSPGAESYDINMCVCVTFFFFSTGMFLPARILRVVCGHLCIHTSLHLHGDSAKCYTSVCLVTCSAQCAKLTSSPSGRPGDISLYAPKYPLSI